MVLAHPKVIRGRRHSISLAATPPNSRMTTNTKWTILKWKSTCMSNIFISLELTDKDCLKFKSLIWMRHARQWMKFLSRFSIQRIMQEKIRTILSIFFPTECLTFFLTQSYKKSLGCWENQQRKCSEWLHSSRTSRAFSLCALITTYKIQSNKTRHYFEFTSRLKKIVSS